MEAKKAFMSMNAIRRGQGVLLSGMGQLILGEMGGRGQMVNSPCFTSTRATAYFYRHLKEYPGPSVKLAVTSLNGSWLKTGERVITSILNRCLGENYYLARSFRQVPGRPC